MSNSDNILLSGGAKGADTYWGIIAQRYDHDVMHFSFQNHTSFVDHRIKCILSNEELSIADAPLVKANKTLKRRIPKNKPWLYNLLRRNWYQVRDSHEVYAVSSLSQNAVILNLSDILLNDIPNITGNDDTLCVNGGTSWAIQMFCDKPKNGNVYLYDQKSQKILLSMENHHKFWIDIGYIKNGTVYYYDSDYAVPKPTGIYAGIGSRDLTDDGEKFIESVYNQ